MRRILFLLAFALLPFLNSAQSDLFVSKSFLILATTTDYEKALSEVKNASKNLNIPIDLRGVYPDTQQEGLTSDEVCGCGEKHGYFPRGRDDNDGTYLSIEYTNAYDGFTDGYFIVVVRSGDRESVEEQLAIVKTYKKDAYIKDAPIYMGCMH